MKTAITPTYIFTPSAGTLNLSGITAFNVEQLFAVINTTAGVVIYAQGQSSLGYTSLSASTLTLSYNVSTMSSTDKLMIIYEVVGRQTSATSSSITLANDDTTALAIGTTADVSWAGTGSSSVVAALKAIWILLNSTIKVSPGGDIGTDRSSNIPTGPGTNSTFTYNGSTLTLLLTFQANTLRKQCEINNTTGSQIVIVLDDGNNTTANTSLLPIASTTAYAQGGSWTSNVEQGRIRVYGTAGTFCYGREN
jgi:hypothetical protein